MECGAWLVLAIAVTALLHCLAAPDIVIQGGYAQALDLSLSSCGSSFCGNDLLRCLPPGRDRPKRWPPLGKSHGLHASEAIQMRRNQLDVKRSRDLICWSHFRAMLPLLVAMRIG